MTAQMREDSAATLAANDAPLSPARYRVSLGVIAISHDFDKKSFRAWVRIDVNAPLAMAFLRFLVTEIFKREAVPGKADSVDLSRWPLWRSATVGAGPARSGRDPAEGETTGARTSRKLQSRNSRRMTAPSRPQPPLR